MIKMNRKAFPIAPLSKNLLIILFFTNILSAEVIISVVNRVIDGDTIEIVKDDKFVKLRLYGIDAPESTQKYGKEASEKLVEILHPNNVVKINILNKDRYGRYIATVHTTQKNVFYINSYNGYSDNLGLYLVDQGLAWHYKKYSNCEELEAAENFARLNKLGIWSDDEPTPPWVYRKQN